MTKTDLLKLAGMENETVDCALPQDWVDNVRVASGGMINPAQDYVWRYKNSNIGSPVSIGELFVKAIKNGNLIPIDFLNNIIELARDPAYSDEQLKTMVKAACEHF